MSVQPDRNIKAAWQNMAGIIARGRAKRLRTSYAIFACTAAALVFSAGTTAIGQEDNPQQANETLGYGAFEQYCMQSFEWHEQPGVTEIPSDQLTADEQRAIPTYGAMKFYLVNEKPRIILGREWKETRLGPAMAVKARCTVFAYENIWTGMAGAMEKLTGLAAIDRSRPEDNLDMLRLFDKGKMISGSQEARPLFYLVSRRSGGSSPIEGTTMYQAIM